MEPKQKQQFALNFYSYIPFNTFLDNLSETDLPEAISNGPGSVHKYYVLKVTKNLRIKENSPP